MQEVKQYPSGTFSWIDLATTDAAAAKQFYGQLFGWEAHDMPAGEAGIYTMLTLAGREVAALYEMNADMRSQGVPPHWLSYVTVDDVDTTAEKAASLGGTLLSPPFDVMESGRMALIQDPTGAMFALWQARQHIGAKLVNMPGAFGWNELATRDIEKATAFYNALFGWDTMTAEMPTGNYTSFSNNGRAVGGMLEMTEEWGDIPPAWTVYFGVEDCDAAAQKVQDLGGAVLVPPTDIPDIGRFAVVQDPQGATFTVMRMDMVDPPPGYEATA